MAHLDNPTPTPASILVIPHPPRPMKLFSNDPFLEAAKYTGSLAGLAFAEALFFRRGYDEAEINENKHLLSTESGEGSQ